jgi:hypothetical protein
MLPAAPLLLSHANVPLGGLSRGAESYVWDPARLRPSEHRPRKTQLWHHRLSAPMTATSASHVASISSSAHNVLALLRRYTCSSAALPSTSGGMRGMYAATGGASPTKGMRPAARTADAVNDAASRVATASQQVCTSVQLQCAVPSAMCAGASGTCKPEHFCHAGHSRPALAVLMRQLLCGGAACCLRARAATWLSPGLLCICPCS